MPEFSIFILFNGNFSQNRSLLVNTGQGTVCFIIIYLLFLLRKKTQKYSLLEDPALWCSQEEILRFSKDGLHLWLWSQLPKYHLRWGQIDRWRKKCFHYSLLGVTRTIIVPSASHVCLLIKQFCVLTGVSPSCFGPPWAKGLLKDWAWKGEDSSVRF